jgi:hypothetical protein
MQSSGQYDNVESTALAKGDRADNSDVPKIQRESIRTRRERLHGMRENIERTLAVGVSQELLNGFDIFSIRLQQGDEGVTGRMPADLLVNATMSGGMTTISSSRLPRNWTLTLACAVFKCSTFFF